MDAAIRKRTIGINRADRTGVLFVAKVALIMTEHLIALVKCHFSLAFDFYAGLRAVGALQRLRKDARELTRPRPKRLAQSTVASTCGGSPPAFGACKDPLQPIKQLSRSARKLMYTPSPKHRFCTLQPYVLDGIENNSSRCPRVGKSY